MASSVLPLSTRSSAAQSKISRTLLLSPLIDDSNSSSTILTILGGKIKDLRPFLLEERIPEGWQPRVRHPMGLTMAEFNQTAFRVELGIKEELPPSFGFSSEVQQKKKM